MRSSNEADGYTRMKRVVDIVISVVCLILLSPLMILIMGLIKVTSRGPIIYVQPRVGKRGELFDLYKFRSMVFNAHELGNYQTKINDERITQVGKILRRHSLDELPQLLNVLRGEMSIVGPRPDTPMQKQRYTRADWEKRIAVTPGLTGLAQATKRSLASHEERLKLDLEYIDQQNLLLDLKIIFLTISKLRGQGSN